MVAAITGAIGTMGADLLGVGAAAIGVGVGVFGLKKGWGYFKKFI